MADTKISQFTLLEALQTGDFVPVVREGDTDNYRYDIHALEQLILNKRFKIFDNINERDNYTAGNEAFLCVVVDASDDGEVDSGGALYAWKPGDPGEYKLLAKYGELDMAVLIAAAIDEAAGKATLADADKIGIVDSEDGNTLKSHTWANVTAALESIYAMWQEVNDKVQLLAAKALNMQSKKIEGLADGTENNDAVNKGYVDEIATRAGLIFYLTNETDDPQIEDYLIACAADCPDTAFSVTKENIANDTQIGAWITRGDFTETQPFTLVAGNYDLNIFANRTAGNKDFKIYWKLFTRSDEGVEVEIEASSISEPVNTTIRRFELLISLSENIELPVGYRVVGKLYATEVGTGTDTDATVYGGQARDSYISIPSNIAVFRELFAPIQHDNDNHSTNYLPITTATTGIDIHFYTSEIYNSPGTPATANITDDLTGAKIGIVQKIYHNHSTAPTFPAGWVKIGEGEYVTDVLNIIYAEWVSGTRVEYWIIQEA